MVSLFPARIRTRIMHCIVLVSFPDDAGVLPRYLKWALELYIIKWSYHNYRLLQPALHFMLGSGHSIPLQYPSRSGCGCSANRLTTSDGCLFILVKCTCRFNSHLNLRPTETIRWYIRVILLVYELEYVMYKQSLRVQPATNTIPSSYHLYSAESDWRRCDAMLSHQSLLIESCNDWSCSQHPLKLPQRIAKGLTYAGDVNCGNNGLLWQYIECKYVWIWF